MRMRVHNTHNTGLEHVGLAKVKRAIGRLFMFALQRFGNQKALKQMK